MIINLMIWLANWYTKKFLEKELITTDLNYLLCIVLVSDTAYFTTFSKQLAR